MQQFKRYLPYVFPVIALIIVLLLLFRWYSMNTQRQGDITPFGEGVEIENLSEDEARQSLRGVGDYKSVDLEGESDAMGQIRYEIVDDKVKFTVFANLPDLNAGFYQVWLREKGGAAIRQAFRLEPGKGGYMGSAAISADVLPFEVVVSQEMTPDNALEKVVMQGVIEAVE